MGLCKICTYMYNSPLVWVVMSFSHWHELWAVHRAVSWVLLSCTLSCLIFAPEAVETSWVREQINMNGREVCHFGMDNLDMLHNNPVNTTYVTPLTSTKHEHFTYQIFLIQISMCSLHNIFSKCHISIIHLKLSVCKKLCWSQADCIQSAMTFNPLCFW
jgi:hypothetical protein